MLQFSRDYFEAEERDGFYIEPMMKNAWAAQLEVLSKIDAICREYEIPYFADWGTLLGAVRHGGFIPWDDDIDICMKRADLERFMYVLDNCQDELESLSIYSDPNWGAHAVKVVNSTAVIVDRQKIREYHGFSLTAGIDIFTIDYVPRDKALEEEQYDILRTISQTCHLKREMEEYSPLSPEYLKGMRLLREFLDKIKTTCQIEFSEENPTEQELYILIEEVAALYGDEDSDYLTQVACLGVGMDYYISKEAYASEIRMPFENMMIPVPAGYDELLRKKYGADYMVPQNKSAGHDYPFYGILIQELAQRKYNGDIDKTKKYVDNLSTDYYRRFLDREGCPRISDELFFEEGAGNNDIWAVQMEILEEVKRLCRLHHTEVFVIGNPMDEDGRYGDLHLAMKRNDYITIVNAIPEELDVWFDYDSVYNKESVEDIRLFIYTDGYREDIEKYKQRFHGCQKRVSVDIVVLDAIEDDSAKADARKTLVQGLLMTAQNVGTAAPYTEAEQSIVAHWKNAVQIDINMEGNLRNEFYKTADLVAGGYRGTSKNLYIAAAMQHGEEKIYPGEWFEHAVEVSVGKLTIPMPVGYREMMGKE